MAHFNRVLDLIASSSIDDCLHIVSPYITVRPIREILRRLSPYQKIELTTTFDQELFLEGASSLGAIRLLNRRKNSSVYIVDNLHAKVYIKGERALVGSANCTDRGLGYSSQSNIEILCDVKANRPEIAALTESLKISRRRLQEGDICSMIEILAASNNLARSVFRKRLEAVLEEDKWIPSCSLRYLLRYLSDGSFHRIPAENKADILKDAQYLEARLGEKALKDGDELIASISLLPIIQLAIDSTLRKTVYLDRCLAARGITIGKIEALDNWAKACLVADRKVNS